MKLTAESHIKRYLTVRAGITNTEPTARHAGVAVPIEGLVEVHGHDIY